MRQERLCPHPVAICVTQGKDPAIALTHARDRGHTGAGAGRHHHTATVRHSVSDHRHHYHYHHDTLTDQVRQVTHHQADDSLGWIVVSVLIRVNLLKRN